ncbi:MAG: hypothetical protein V4725_02035 [Bacteroidota bacterium]|nr:hypothetical protein [Ferruginibacter sp.]
MKKLLPVIFALLGVAFTSCRHNHDNLEISYHDADHEYKMEANFGRQKMREVEYYLNRKLGTKNKVSFAGTHTDAMFTLDDQTQFYLRKSPGYVEIKLDKDENSKAAYKRIKSMCEGMKLVLTK